MHMHVTGGDCDEYLEHSLLATASNPAFSAVPCKTFQLGVVWDCNLFAAQCTQPFEIFAPTFEQQSRKTNHTSSKRT